MNQMAFLPPVLYELKRTWAPNHILLEKLLDSMWDKPALEQLLVWITRGSLEAYETKSGLVLLEKVDWTRGRELNIYGMVGRDILKRGESIVKDLKAIALHKGCSMIGGVGVPKGWQRFAPSLGFAPVSTHFVMEID